jgi:hypothetical protein
MAFILQAAYFCFIVLLDKLLSCVRSISSGLCRIVLESRNDDACKGKNCQMLADRPGLYAHGTLHFSNPPQQVVLFGDVTPFECAAAHGHVQAMKLLVQVCGEQQGRRRQLHFSPCIQQVPVTHAICSPCRFLSSRLRICCDGGITAAAVVDVVSWLAANLSCFLQDSAVAPGKPVEVAHTSSRQHSPCSSCSSAVPPVF